jgi:hypothetical protein
MKRVLAVAILIFGINFPSYAQGKLTATATAHSNTLTWTASVTTGVNYNVYKAPCSGFVQGTGTGSVPGVGTCTSLGAFTSGATGITGTTYVDTNVSSGQSFTYQVTSFCPTTGTCPAGISGESVPSNQVSALTPTPTVPPAPPTGLSGTVAVNHVGTQNRITATWSDAPGVSTMYAMFNSDKNYTQMNGSPTPTAAGMYSVTYTGAPFNGVIDICDAKNACLILPFIG